MTATAKRKKTVKPPLPWKLQIRKGDRVRVRICVDTVHEAFVERVPFQDGDTWYCTVSQHGTLPLKKITSVRRPPLFKVDDIVHTKANVVTKKKLPKGKLVLLSGTRWKVAEVVIEPIPSRARPSYKLTCAEFTIERRESRIKKATTNRG